MQLDAGAWEVVPHGLCRSLPRVAAPAPDGVLRVLSFGNRARAKGLLDLVRALAALPPGSARLTLLGREVDPCLDEELRVAAGHLPLELHDGHDAAGLAEAAARSDLAAFPSLAAESYGLVVEEALALGLPVWVSDRGALPEVLAEAAGRWPLPGGVLPAGRPDLWTEAFRRLVARPSRLHDARALVPAEVRTVASAVERELQVYAEALHTDPVREP
jgi:glycosyltransferase involved in cell wall biosynthesis